MNKVSIELAKKLSRYGWQRGQTYLSYKKRHKKTIYDEVINLSKYDLGYDAANLVELRQMGKIIGFESETIKADTYATELIEFLKTNKKKLTGLSIIRQQVCPECEGTGFVSSCCNSAAYEVTTGKFQCSLCNRFCKKRICHDCYGSGIETNIEEE